jgi:hypothetical protein
MPRWLAAAGATLALAVSAGLTAPAASASSIQTCRWQPPTLINGWQSANAQSGTGDPSYCVENGIVYLSGSVSSQTGSGSAATLPQAAWPTHWPYFTVNTGQGNASLSIRPTGQITVFGGTGQPDETALSGISYQVTSWPDPAG